VRLFSCGGRVLGEPLEAGHGRKLVVIVFVALVLALLALWGVFLSWGESLLAVLVLSVFFLLSSVFGCWLLSKAFGELV
jgi:uncharacterized membrane protein